MEKPFEIFNPKVLEKRRKKALFLPLQKMIIPKI
jgi:hypothetical protein